MSSSKSEMLSSMISPSLATTELIRLIKHSFRGSKFSEVEKILVDREREMKFEIEGLVRDCELARGEASLLEKAQALVEGEKLKLEEKFRGSEKQCEELKEAVDRLSEEKKLSTDKERRAKERYDKLWEENSKMKSEKNGIISQLNEKIKELNTKNLETERLLGVYKEKFQVLDAKAVKMEKEIEDLRQEKLAVDQTVGELRIKKLESDKLAIANKKKAEDLTLRIEKVEETLAKILNVKVGDLAHIVDNMDKLVAAQEGGDVSPDSEGGIGDLGNGDAENVAVVSPGMRSTCISPKKEQHTSELGSDERVPVKEQLMSEAGHSSKMICSFNAAGGVIVITDSDSEDELNPVTRTANISDIYTNVGVDDVMLRKTTCNKANKRNATDCKEGSPISSDPKRKRLASGSEDICLPIDVQAIRELKSDSDDESCSDSCMDNLIASLRSRNNDRKWMFAVDMLKAFENNAELCMNAVCALYRREISAAKGSSSSRRGGFTHVDAMSGCALAKYLIDGDPELRLRKSVCEVEKEKPDAISQCKRIATNYYEKLHDIYCSGEDPLFCQR